VLEGEGILKVEDGEEKADEFSQRDDQCYDQRGAFGGQDEYATNAHILGETVTKNVEPQLRYTQSSK
jgi:hypothetical protein